MPPNGALTEADRATWAAYARYVVPLPGRMPPALPAEAEPGATPPAPARARVQPPQARPRPSGLRIGDQPPGLDAATWQRFRTGRLTAARRLDLHGYTAQRAFIAVENFLRIAHAEHVRCVEIVTGRGQAEGGVIRRELPMWLNLPALRPLVLAAAHPHPANPGAVRLLLRRMR